MIWREAGSRDIQHVISNLREQDAAEMTALFGDCSRAQWLADVLMQQNLSIATLALCPSPHEAPVAIAGARSTALRSARVWLIATGEWPLIARHAARFARKVFAPCVLDINVVRTDAVVLQSNGTARRFAEWCGAVNETPAGMAWYGKGGEAFCQYARIAPPDAPVWKQPAP